MRFLVLGPVALALVLLAQARSMAWNAVGHMAVARRAYDELDKPQKDAIARILAQHPHYKEFLAKNFPGEGSLDEWVFLRAAAWPDWVRPGKEGKPRPTTITRYHRADDHFVDIPLVLFPTNKTPLQGQELGADSEKANTITALRQRLSELRAKNTVDEDKAIALCWLLHLVGDLHQPLHCATLISPQYPRGDQGGNSFALRVNGRPWRLHTFWDELLGEDPDYTSETAEHDLMLYKAAIAAAELMRDPVNRRENLPVLQLHPYLTDWARESFDLARTVAYRNGALQGVALAFGEDPPGDAPEAGATYESQARDVARQRVALAGYRLADRLKGVFRKATE